MAGVACLPFAGDGGFERYGMYGRVRMSTAKASRYWYPYEEFADNMRAMRTVRQWEYTWKFGYLGHSHDNKAEIARTLEYFSDSYLDRAEALCKAELFLTICDYVALHASFFSSQGMIDTEVEGELCAESALLRAIHHVFTALAGARGTDPNKVLNLARALKALEEGL